MSNTDETRDPQPDRPTDGGLNIPIQTDVPTPTPPSGEPMSAGQTPPPVPSMNPTPPEPMRAESTGDDDRQLPTVRLNDLNRRIEEVNRSFDDMRRSILGALPGRLNNVFHDVNRGLDRLLDTALPTAMSRGRDLFNSVVQQPSLDVYETDEAFIVEAELPGLDPAAITVTSTDNVLTIRGDRQQDTSVRDDGYHRREIAYGTFQRTVPLPAYVVADEASASFKHGVLRVSFPKTDAGRRRRDIPVQTA